MATNTNNSALFGRTINSFGNTENVRGRSLSPPAYTSQVPTYSAYHGTAADHEHTVAAPAIHFGRATTTAAPISYVPPVAPVVLPPAQPVIYSQTYVPPPPQPQSIYVPNRVAYESHVHAEPPKPVTPVVQTQYQSNFRPDPKDEFLCSKVCWAIAAIIGLILLTLALLWGLGVFGGGLNGSNRGPYWQDGSNNVTPVQPVVPVGPIDNGNSGRGRNDWVDPTPARVNVNPSTNVQPVIVQPQQAYIQPQQTYVQPQPHYVQPVQAPSTVIPNVRSLDLSQNSNTLVLPSPSNPQIIIPSSNPHPHYLTAQ